MAKQIEVFQDMSMAGPIAARPALRLALIEAAVDPWRVDLERSAEVARSAMTSEDVILFRRAAGQDYPAAALTLWGNSEGYYVPNIFPLDRGSLTFTQYNTILKDFIERVAAPVADKFGFKVTTTASYQSPDNWLSPNTALKLRRFSAAANKSTGASHPSDERRWFDFLVTIHRSRDKLGADMLARWLYEVDGWDVDSAHKLAGDFERSLALLEFYDEN
ncbi:hypothetical protein [Mesorhizobium sp. 113-3-9]|uniref:hypothetical protein n=1 Tax=Mesorhizobium sp. 113-3-9 TaxID=2744517 RepID=UPI001925F763|nr:hypothetical protein [Mesorhizobium sp. 113-3-9]